MALFNQASKVTNSRPSGIKSVEIPYCFLCRGSGRKKIRHKSRPLFRFYFKLVHPNETQNCYLNFTVNYGFVRHLQKSAWEGGGCMLTSRWSCCPTLTRRWGNNVWRWLDGGGRWIRFWSGWLIESMSQQWQYKLKEKHGKSEMKIVSNDFYFTSYIHTVTHKNLRWHG